VWSIYLLDRLLDARKPFSQAEALGHSYYRRHFKPMAALFSAVAVSGAIVALGFLRRAVLRDGLIALAGVLIYLAAFHFAGRALKIPKEIAAAILFTAGTFLAAWASLPCLSLAWAALAFFILCLANIVAIEAWEWRELASAEPHRWTRWLARTYLYWVVVAAIGCALLGHNEWYASIALSACACALLFVAGRRISLEARRALVDGALLTPALFLLFR
jgi:hypothetical protein